MFQFYLYHPDLGRPQRIKNDPVGWDTLGKSIVRDPKWHGVFFEYTPKLKFVKDGKSVVQYFFDKYDVEANVILIIKKYDLPSRTYLLDYMGKLNYTTYKVSDLFAEVNVEQTGFIQKLKNRQDTKINLLSLLTQEEKVIAPNDNETVAVELHSKVIQKTFRSVYNTDTATISSPEDTDFYIHFTLEPSELNEVDEFFDYAYQVSTVNPVTAKKYTWKFTEAAIHHFILNLHFKISLLSGVASLDINDTEWFFVYGREGAYTTVSLGAFENPLPERYSTGEPLYDAVHNLLPGDEVYIYATYRFHFESVSGNANIKLEKLPNFSVVLNSETVTPATTVPLFLKHEAFARIVESITDEPDSFRSNHYGRTDSEPTAYDEDGEGSLRGMANGSTIRGFPIAERPMHTSFKDLLENCMSIDGVGLGIVTEGNKQRAIVEPLSFFYNTNRVAQFPFVKDIDKEVAEEYYANELEAGSEKWNNEFSNNLDEFNTRREFSLPITQIKKRIMLRTSYSLSGYTIEFLRRDRYIDGSNKDNDRDNDNFIIQLRRDGGNLVTDKDEDFAELNNIFSPETVYNAKLSVMRNIKRNGSMIRGGLPLRDDYEIKLTFGEGNTAFTSRLNTETEVVDENRIAVSKLKKALWIPHVYGFKHNPTRAQLAAIDADPYGIIEFSKTNRDWKRGWLLKTTPDPKSGLRDFRLLRANV